MAAEAEDWIAGERKGRQGGIKIYIDKVNLEYAFYPKKIPIETPGNQLRFKRYSTKIGNIILVPRKLKPEECPKCHGEKLVPKNGDDTLVECEYCKEWI